MIGADLVVSTFTVPATGGAGATITVSDTTTNSGGGAARPLSPGSISPRNSTLDATDTLLTSAHAVPGLAAGGHRVPRHRCDSRRVHWLVLHHREGRRRQRHRRVEGNEQHARQGDHHRRQPRGDGVHCACAERGRGTVNPERHHHESRRRSGRSDGNEVLPFDEQSPRRQRSRCSEAARCRRSLRGLRARGRRR